MCPPSLSSPTSSSNTISGGTMTETPGMLNILNGPNRNINTYKQDNQRETRPSKLQRGHANIASGEFTTESSRLVNNLTSPNCTTNVSALHQGATRPSKLQRGHVTLVKPDIKAKAEVYYGDESCREKFMWLLAQIGLPNGLLTLEEIEECGYVKDTGFVWLKHKKQRDYHKFGNVVICFDAEVTAYFEHNKIKKLTGVKAKEFLIWITLSEISVNHDHNSSITFKTPSGLSKSLPLSLFKFEAIMTHSNVEEIDQVKKLIPKYS
ncbi:hypothetical protein M5689_005290 [Euphorbia peplus]|nr:hypothetical protein M5689_005290 [Euphorbia peplus]